ncbi:DEAD/DEAH box helicase [Apibacter raozihei]|uniref:DEAD/DEAH box helicase n=1 Tax=Apibacter raozihei TaxID=2500547 RepID=UPI000FE3745D|nr:DEAD/DEAH box helicase [Apibacter raozihei]
MTFNDLNIIEPLLRALNDKGYNSPTPIQKETIPHILNERDVLGLAQTGTGKTAAFLLPVIQQLVQKENVGKHNKKAIKALVLAPTRELAIQISDSFKDYTTYLNINHGVIFGGVNKDRQIKTLQNGIDLLIATPGRLLDLMNQKVVDLRFVEFFIIDEADKMLDMGFIHDMKKIIQYLPKQKQTLLFSATMPSMIASLSKNLLSNPVKVEVTPVSSTVDTIHQRVFFVEKSDKNKLLVDLLSKNKDQLALVFLRTKHGADRIVRTLKKAGIFSEAIHGNKSQNARQRILTDFNSRKNKILIATDIAARGIDVSHLELVINYDLPSEPETYVHRIGRTGRAGNSGTAFSFCSQEEQKTLRSIQKLTGKKLVSEKV